MVVVRVGHEDPDLQPLDLLRGDPAGRERRPVRPGFRLSPIASLLVVEDEKVIRGADREAAMAQIPDFGAAGRRRGRGGLLPGGLAGDSVAELLDGRALEAVPRRRAAAPGTDEDSLPDQGHFFGERVLPGDPVGEPGGLDKEIADAEGGDDQTRRRARPG